MAEVFMIMNYNDDRKDQNACDHIIDQNNYHESGRTVSMINWYDDDGIDQKSYDASYHKLWLDYDDGMVIIYIYIKCTLILPYHELRPMKIYNIVLWYIYNKAEWS